MDVIVTVGHFDEVIDMKARRYELTNKEWGPNPVAYPVLLLPLAGRWNLEKDLRALRGLEHWRGAEHGFSVDQSIRAGRSWNKKTNKSQTSSSIGKVRGGLNTKIHTIVGKACGLWLFDVCWKC